ncbi:increased loss of mitochondrial DNA protein 1 [Annulohypoxylon truncatum]|uniref:increased loss of mitochondrial DNA protein 1 n=1 Tax=Annulohypoxylon truncatum TaxID=327061 RepID=UPI002007DE3A|nr:increased loss of mitochondrial DNA protein 1 [Annulohypoxylon truncatum]KAI1205293.1 increased loss of mitochondrial DNA protein 1 [Annulohypoxylon truncatum]
MALISVKTILTSLSLFHITLAYFFYTNPNAIADQALVYVLGEAMGMPQTTSFTTPSSATSFLSITLLVLGLSDLLTLSMPEEIWLIHYWGSQAPLRITVFAFVSLYTYFSTPSYGRAGPSRMSHPLAPPNVFVAGSSMGGAGGGGTGGDGLRNRVFFTFAFLEFLSWFWVWVTLKEEASSFVARKRRRGSASNGAARGF